MRTVEVLRGAETTAVRQFLHRATAGPAGLVVEGEAGIGKTTLLWDAAETAEAQGFRVMLAQGAPTEVRYAYAAVADLFRDVSTTALAHLPEMQWAALGAVLWHSDDGPAVNERVVAAAFASVIQRMTADAPVLVCVDDAQWLDKSSRAVIGYAARRLTGRAGIVVAVRSDEPEGADLPAWLSFARPDLVERIQMRPLSLGGVHALISGRLGQTLPRPTITQIHQIAGGNPLFALELARSVIENPGNALIGLPDTLATLASHRIGHIDDEVATVLLAASCAVSPTVERVSRVTGIDTARVVELIDSMQDRGVIALDGNALRFRHPLFATAVYNGASPVQRRTMHCGYGEVAEEPELKARHLALAATTADRATLEALDAAAVDTLVRGAPAVAAELTELAIKLGGDGPSRRLRAAESHFRSGALAQARTHLRLVIDGSAPRSTLRCVALMALAAVRGYDENLTAAVDVLKQAVVEAVDQPELQLRARLLLVPIIGLTGQMPECVDAARTAVADAQRLGDRGLRSQALAIWVLVSFMHGLGVDRRALQAALDSGDATGTAAATFQAGAVAAVVAGWSGELGEARAQMRTVTQGFLRCGTEIDIIWAASHATMLDIWSGRYAEAAAKVDDALQRAEQIGGKHMLIYVWSSQAAVAAYAGREDEARDAARGALDAAAATGAAFAAAGPTATLGFLEVSLGDYSAALAVLEPLLAAFDPDHGTEIVVGAYLPDAVEALTALGRVEDAEPLIAALERNGARHDRPWMLAVGARGRAHVLAARGDLDAAERAAHVAMTHHLRLPMPFEAARTRLLLGQLQRRRRRKQAAEATLREALETFDGLGAQLWAQRARVELGRLTAPAGTGSGLSATEQRVAERAAAGLSNKQIAAELFIAPKTVEMNLSSVYRKLSIRSRAGLSAALNDSG